MQAVRLIDSGASCDRSVEQLRRLLFEGMRALEERGDSDGSLNAFDSVLRALRTRPVPPPTRPRVSICASLALLMPQASPLGHNRWGESI